MHPLVLLLAAWLAVVVVTGASALLAGRQRARRPELSLSDPADEPGP
jgi:hypothetical protein